jgi:excisionase family DNA binding protein
MLDKLLTIKEVARILKISERTIYNKVRPNSKFQPFPIKVKRVGKLIRFAQEDVQRYIDKI